MGDSVRPKRAESAFSSPGERNCYDETSDFRISTGCPEGEEVTEVYGLGGAMPIYWLDGHTAIFDCHSFIIFYDFAADSGQVLDDMNEIAAQFGRFSTYCGSQMGGTGPNRTHPQMIPGCG